MSKVETNQSYVVQTPQDEYRRNRLQLKEPAIPTTVPVSASTVNTTTSPIVQPTGATGHAKDVLTNALCPIKELLYNNKGNFSVLAECVPDLPSTKLVEKS